MKGYYRYHAPAKRYFVSVYCDKKENRIWKYNGEPIWHEKTAEKLLNKIRAEIDDGRFNLQSYFSDSPLSLKSFSEQWLKASTACAATKKFYQKAVNKIIDHFGPDMDIRYFTHSKLQIFYNELDMSVKGKYNILSPLKTMLHYAYNDELIPRIPPFPKLPVGLKEDILYLTLEQQQSVLAAIQERHRAIFEFAMEYGLRIGEVCALQRDCVTDTEIIIKRSMSDGAVRQSTKTGKQRVYGITANARIILDNLPLYLSPYVFSREKGTSYTWKSMTKRWKTACKKAGIEINLYNAIRHSLGCQLLDQGVEMEMVRDVLGHTSTNITRRYAQRSQQRITNVLEFRSSPDREPSEKNINDIK